MKGARTVIAGIIQNNGVFPKYFPEFSDFRDKNICHYSKST